MSGAIKDLRMDGHSFAITNDSDLTFIDGGNAVTESQKNSKGTHAIVDGLTPKVTGSTIQFNLNSVDYSKFKELRKGSATGERYSASFTTMEGTKVNSQKAYIVIDADGGWTSREGKQEFEIHSEDDWSDPKSV